MITDLCAHLSAVYVDATRLMCTSQGRVIVELFGVHWGLCYDIFAMELLTMWVIYHQDHWYVET